MYSICSNFALSIELTGQSILIALDASRMIGSRSAMAFGTYNNNCIPKKKNVRILWNIYSNLFQSRKLCLLNGNSSILRLMFAVPDNKMYFQDFVTRLCLASQKMKKNENIATNILALMG